MSHLPLEQFLSFSIKYYSGTAYLQKKKKIPVLKSRPFSRINTNNERSEIFAAVLIKIQAFLDATSCHEMSVNPRRLFFYIHYFMEQKPS